MHELFGVWGSANEVWVVSGFDGYFRSTNPVRK
jgi:hypothetical protein